MTTLFYDKPGALPIAVMEPASGYELQRAYNYAVGRLPPRYPVPSTIGEVKVMSIGSFWIDPDRKNCRYTLGRDNYQNAGKEGR